MREGVPQVKEDRMQAVLDSASRTAFASIRDAISCCAGPHILLGRREGRDGRRHPRVQPVCAPGLQGGCAGSPLQRRRQHHHQKVQGFAKLPSISTDSDVPSACILELTCIDRRVLTLQGIDMATQPARRSRNLLHPDGVVPCIMQ